MNTLKVRKEKKRVKKAILSIILIAAILVLILFKAPIFNIKNLEIQGNKSVDKNKIIKLDTVLNKNIFYLDLKSIKETILLNPYIKEVEIEKSYPNKIIVAVEERKPSFFVKDGEGFLVLNEELRIMERLSSIDGLDVTEISGLNIDNKDIGSIITKESKKQKVANSLAELLKQNTSNVKFKSFDITKTQELKLTVGDIIISIGNDENLKNKLNYAINIITDQNLNGKKGYIDVSFDGNPVFKVE